MGDRDDRKRTDGRSSEEQSFEEAMRGVQPVERLSGGPGRVEPPGPARRRGRRGRGRPPAPARFEIERTGERIAAIAPGADAAQLARLRAGELPAEMTLDLHGFPELEARGAVRDALRRARRSGMRCVKVIHGRGRRSGGEPVLKTALPGWLAEPPLGSWVAAFASAPAGHGGPGATLVLLRREGG